VFPPFICIWFLSSPFIIFIHFLFPPSQILHDIHSPSVRMPQ
jgi:hypothetical protein